MRVRSISDVITNSSTEVWMIKESLLQDAMRDLGDLTRGNRLYSKGQENLWEKFKIFQVPEDFRGDWRSKYILPREIQVLFTPYRLPAHDKSLLMDWGHTGEEISAKEKEVTKARQEELRATDLSPYLGRAVAVFGDHISRWEEFYRGPEAFGVSGRKRSGRGGLVV